MKAKKWISLFLTSSMLFLLFPIQTTQAAETANTADQLIAHYNMSKADGKLTDVTGHGFDAAYVGFTDGDFLQEQSAAILNFTGDKSKYVKLPTGLVTDETFTIETKFSTSTGAAHWLYSLGNKTGTWPNVKNYVFFNPNQSNGTVRFGIKDASTELLFQNASINSGKFNTFTTTFEGGKISHYLNGDPVGSITHTYSIMDILSTGVDAAAGSIGFIGKSLYTPDAAFTGKLADFKVYNYTLSAAEIKQNNTAPVVVITDAALVEQVKQNLVIPSANDVRGNITLPKSKDGATITWQTDRPDVVNVNDIQNVNYDHIPAGVVTRQDTDTQVKLTAAIMYGQASASKEITITVKAKAKELKPEDFKEYLFTHFTGESAIGEQVYFASSKDGFHWDDLNDNLPVLTSDLGEKGVRDMYMLRSAEGDKFYLMATDLRIASGKGWSSAINNGSKSLIIWESTDLVNWSPPRMVPVSVPESTFTWAPEAIYDEKTGEYIVFWAAYLKKETDTSPRARIHYAKTRDFVTFTPAQEYIDRPDHDIIDTTIIEVNGKYYRASADGQITFEESDQLLHSPWSIFGTLQSVGLTGKDVEGPEIFKLNGKNEWVILVDQFATGKGYLPITTTDLASPSTYQILNSSQYSFGTNKKRHGNIISLTQSEYDAIMTKWADIVVPVNEAPQANPILEYKFDETSTNGTIQDTSGHNNQGTLNGNATYVTDQEKNSEVLYLDGTSHTFAALPTGFFDGRNTVSISMDVKAETVSGNFFTFAIGKSSMKYMFLRTKDTEIRNAMTTNTYISEQEAKAGTASIKSKWINLKLVITPTSMTIYKDGILFAENNNVTVSMSDLGSNLLAYLGKSLYAGDAYFKGYFDNVKVYNRALTETEIAGVNSGITSTLTGGSSVSSEESFDITYGLSNVTQSVYAQVMTFNYDSMKMQFVSVESLKSGLSVVSTVETPGQVRLIAASTGAGNAITSAGELLKLHFKAKAVTQATTGTISMSNVVVADHTGVETAVNSGTDYNFEIIFTDKTALNTAITSAQNLHDAAVEGSGKGKYPTGSKETLQAAIDSAKAIADDHAATQQQVNQAVDQLATAVQIFTDSVNLAVEGDLNGDDKVSIGDLAIVAAHYGRTSTDPNWNSYKQADVNDDGIIDVIDLGTVARLIMG